MRRRISRTSHSHSSAIAPRVSPGATTCTWRVTDAGEEDDAAEEEEEEEEEE